MAAGCELWGAEKTAKNVRYFRETLDAWALRSHELAVKARDAEVFGDIILPLGRKRNVIRGSGGLCRRHFWKRSPLFMKME